MKPAPLPSAPVRASTEGFPGFSPRIPGAIPFGVLLLALAGCDGSSSTLEPDPRLECTEASTLVLAPGEAERRTGSAARTFCMAPTSGAEFVIVASFLGSESGASLPLTMEATATRGLSGSASASSFQARTGDEAGHGPLATEDPSLPRAEPVGFLPDRPDAQFDARLRAREQRELGPLVRTPASSGASPVGAAGVPPALGTLVELNAQAGTACSNALLRTGEVMAVSSEAIVVADTARPAGGFTLQDFQSAAITFDTLVAPVVRRYFGEFSDLDGNGRVILFFTPEVNRLTAANSSRNVGGFFFARDLFPREDTPQLSRCPTSNEGEILYLQVPDPSGTINGNARSLEALRRSTPSVTAHELQHLVNASRRIHVVPRQASAIFESVWLNEGLSHIAEEVLFFESSGLARESRLTLSDVQGGGTRALDAINTFHVANILRYQRFLAAPEIHSAYDSVDNLEARGAAQSFLRYASDRLPRSDEAFFQALVDAPRIGLENLGAELGGDAVLRRWLADWSVANFADSRVEGTSPEFQLRSWSHPTLFTALSLPAFPLRTRPLSPDSPVSVQLRAGGSVYGRFSVPGPETARVDLGSGGGPLPASLHVTVLRTR